MSSEIHKNVCEICGNEALSGILENYYDNNIRTNQIRIRYSCIDHYLQIYKKIKEERKIRNDLSSLE